MTADVHSADGYFAIIPETILDTDVSAQAIRLYAVLRRYADQRTGHAHPSRKTLATRMRVRDVKTVDRAVADLERIGAVSTFPRYVGEDGSVALVKDAAHPEQTSNGYTVHAQISGQGRGTEGRGGPPSGGEGVLPLEGDEPEPLEPEPGEPEKTVPRERGKATTSKGTRLPDDFPVTAEMEAWATTNAPGTSMRDHDRFCDYWRAKAGRDAVKVDWLATWRNWMRRASDERPGGAGALPRPGGSGPRPGPDQRAADVAALARSLQDHHNARQIGA